jgi:amino acid transporter
MSAESPAGSPNAADAPTTPAAPEGGGFHRTLTFKDLLVYGMVFIGPMAPVGIFGVLDAKSNGAVVLVYLAATFAMGLTAFSYAQMVRVVPRAGSVFSYARAGLGEGPGFMAGWLVILDYVLIPAVAYTFTGIALNSLVPEVSRWVWTALALLATTGLNLLGVRVAVRVSMVVLAFEIVVLSIFVVAAVVVLVQNGPQRPWASPLHGVGGFMPGAVIAAVSVAVLSYLGFDAIASFAEEHEGPSARVGRALLFCLVLAGLLFIAQSWLGALLTSTSPAELAANPTEQGTVFYSSVDSEIGHWMKVLMTLAKAVGAAFAALTAQAAAGRLLYAMARERRLPAALGRLDPKAGVPRRTLLLAAVVTAAAAILASTRADGLDQLSSIVNIGALGGFVLLHLSVIGWFGVRGRRDGDGTVGSGGFRPVPHLVVPLLGVGVTVAVIVEANRSAQIIGAAWLVVGLVVLAVQRRLRSRRVVSDGK